MTRNTAFGGIGRALAVRDYRYYWIGLSASAVGSWAYRTAVGWLAWSLTGSTAALGFVVFIEVVPAFVIGPPAGALVDRVGALRATKVTQVVWALHAGVTATIADSAGGYAAYTLFPADASVLTTEFKINLLAPAAGERLRALGRVVKPGRTLTICDVEVFAEQDGREKLCAKLLQTLMTLHGKPDAAG